MLIWTTSTRSWSGVKRRSLKKSKAVESLKIATQDFYDLESGKKAE
jgi:hypothetical protein